MVQTKLLIPILKHGIHFQLPLKRTTLDLPYEDSFSYNVNAPDTLTWCHRVLCGPAKDGHDLAAKAAIAGGREIWGFPKHPDMADLDFDYSEEKAVSFTARHQGNEVMTVKVKRPESTEGYLTVDADAITETGACITPKQNFMKPSFVAKQTRYTLRHLPQQCIFHHGTIQLIH